MALPMNDKNLSDVHEGQVPDTKEKEVMHIESMKEDSSGDPAVATDSPEVEHAHHERMSFRKITIFIAMIFLWTGSQLPIYFLGAIPPIIYADIGGVDKWVWYSLAYLLALAAIIPFVGSLSDLIGRRYISLIGAAFIVISMIVCGTAHKMEQLIGGMAVAGVGAGICELTALAVTAEIVPVRERGKYVAGLVFTIIPFCPSVLWSQLIAHNSNWRYTTLFCGLWALMGLLGVLFFYFPPNRPASGKTRKEILQEIDYIGGGTCVIGVILFLMALTWGGYQHPWNSANVIATLVLGVIFLFIIFPIWEVKFAKNPMFPRRLGQHGRLLTLLLIITAISGANFFSVLSFWPTQAYNVYGHDPVGVGLRGLPIGFGVILGAVIVLSLISRYPKRIREFMIISACFMTAGCGAMASATRDNENAIYGILVVTSLGIGGIVIPVTIMITIICPDDIIATATALTLSVRVVGGCIGYSAYYNVFVNKFIEKAPTIIGGAMAELGITNATYILEAITLTGDSLVDELRLIPGLESDAAWNAVVYAGQVAYAKSYVYLYYVSIAFGAVSIVATCFLGDISQFMDDRVAVSLY